jgi:hypothetical protein
LAGQVVAFDQSAEYGASGMDDVGYLYVPAVCKGGSTSCKLHVALHGCQQSYGYIGDKFVQNTGYNQWAGRIRPIRAYISLFPQIIIDFD